MKTVFFIIILTAFNLLGSSESKAVLSKLPELTKFVQADYPDELFKNQVEGEVLLLIDISEKGDITKVEVLEATKEEFKEPAVNAVKKFIFSPAEFQDKPVPVRITYKYFFTIKDYQTASEEEVEKAQEKKQVIVEEKEYDSIKGKIVSYGDREPAPFIIVNAVDQNQQAYETISDKNGFFIFKNLKDGKYKISVPKQSKFLQFETTEEVKKGILVNLNIFLPQENINIYEMTVVSEKGKKEVTKQVITVEELMKIPGTGGDAVKVVQNLPGVSRTGAFSGEVAVRGGKSSETMIYIDGSFVPLLFHFGGLSSVINSRLILDVSYLPGGYSVQYGRALGGTINVKTAPVKTKKETKNIHGYFGFDLIDTSAMVEIPIDETSGIAMAFRRSYIDFVLPALLPDDISNTAMVLPVYYDWQIKYNKRINSKNRFELLLFASKDEMKFSFDDPQGDANIVGDFGLETSFINLNAIWEYKYSSKFYIDLNLSFQYDNFDIKMGEFLSIDVKQYPLTYRMNFNWKLLNNLLLTIGTDGLFAWFNYDILAPNTQPSGSGEFMPLGTYNQVHRKEDAAVWMPSIYSEITFDINKFRFIAGLRGDTDSTTKKGSIDPRLAVIYTINKDWLIKGSAGKYSQRPLDESNFTKEWGNPDLGYQSALQYTVGFEHRFTDFIKAAIEGFYYDKYNLAVSTDRLDKNNERINLDNSGKGRAYGMEIFIRHSLSNIFFGWISYTLMRSEVKDDSSDGWEIAALDQTHILTVLGSWRLPWNYQIGFKLRYVTGSPQTPVVGSVYDADNSAYIPIFGKSNSVRNDDFFQLDIRIDKTWQFKYWKLTTYLDIQNVTYYKNQEGEIYNYNYTEKTKAEGLPFFPSIGVRGVF